MIDTRQKGYVIYIMVIHSTGGVFLPQYWVDILDTPHNRDLDQGFTSLMRDPGRLATAQDDPNYRGDGSTRATQRLSSEN